MQSFTRIRAFIVMLALTIVLAAVPLTATAAGKSIGVTLDGKSVSFDSKPQIVGGSTLVPYRALAEKLGAKVKWDQNSGKISLTKGSKTVELTIGSKTAKIAGKSVALDAAPVTKNGATLVPLRFLGESLGVWVSWKASTSTVVLETKKTFTHAMGKTTLNKVPERVVVLFNGGVDISVLLKVKPVGAVESYVEQPWYKYLRAGMSNVKNLGDETQPSVESIVALKPDVIIGSKMRHEKIYSQLSAIAPTIMTEDIYSWKTNLQTIAEVLNKESISTAFIKDWNNRVADFKSKIGTKARNTEVSIIRFNPDGSARAYMEGFAYNILDELGFAHPAAQKATGKGFIGVTTKEQINLLDGDYIFDFTTDWVGDGGVYKVQQDWTGSDLWKNLDAVKNKKYYKVDVVSWNMSGGAMAAKMMLDDLYFYFDLD
ncbi:stalk domain-containing protein [Paenibacillus methanolicus]|uniref:ABC-type Fe3+-hydroxamate transport system substrate-binding protein n=1 Tax=Paenibacillus methanolicus TaxID=582686 RepID=A0A5S5BUI1_9BACL|nr:stalk domain-containing protein [Paenibacillus methanolicus]TYP70624.1 ABC-type Fe3+-hydroxamate transport system substrate-binding protein [Paenibacillus methanolicus]